MNKFCIRLFWIITSLTFLVNLLALLPINSAYINQIIEMILLGDNSLLELIDLCILSCTFISLLGGVKKGTNWISVSWLLILVIFFFAEEISYGRHLNFDPPNLFTIFNGSDEGNLHSADFLSRFGLEFSNLMYILAGPFFLFVFDERFKIPYLNRILKLPQRNLSTNQMSMYLVGCLTLPFDGLPNDIEMDQIFVNAIYLNLLMFVPKLKTEDSHLEQTNECIWTLTKWCTIIPSLRMFVFYYFDS